MSNALVSGPVDMSTPFSGTFLLEDGESLAAAIKSGDWVAGGLAAFSALADGVAAVVDPIGSLIAAGLGWLMEHLEPLKGWLNNLTGDAGEVAAFAQTWSNISAQLTGSADELVRILGDVDAQEGEAIDAYVRFQTDVAAHLRSAGSWAEGMSAALGVASMIVKIVHDLTRDAIAQIVGSAISWAAEAVLSLGLATPAIIAQVTSRVSSLAARVGKAITRLLSSFKHLTRLMDQLGTLFRKADELFGRVLPGSKSTEVPHVTDGAPVKPLDLPYQNSRPRYAPGQVHKVWENAKGPDGLVRDPLTGEVIHWTPGEPRNGIWDMGHLPEHKYSELKADYLSGRITKEEFLAAYRNPDHYRPETPATNRSHRLE